MTRFLLTVAVLAVIVVLALAMWWGYRNRARRQAATLPAFPATPEGLIERARAGDYESPVRPSTGLYASTVTDASWQDRVAIGDIGHRAEATAHLLPEGLLFDRVGASPLWIAAESVVDARTEGAIAGKVMGRDGLFVVRWQIGDDRFDTGFRADDKDDYESWVPAVRALGSHNTAGGTA
ncbi:MAG: transporter [Actinomycetota bacterium]|nr:transporter [Actinomycetota bacterium]